MKFSRQSRLLKPEQFQSVFRHPIRSDDHYFRVLARENDDKLHRLGMAVSKRVCKRAVDRNRIKRVIRENFRKGIGNRQVEPRLDFVVMPKDRAINVDSISLDNSLDSHWHRLIGIAGQRQTRTQT